MINTGDALLDHHCRSFLCVLVELVGCVCVCVGCCSKIERFHLSETKESGNRIGDSSNDGYSRRVAPSTEHGPIW